MRAEHLPESRTSWVTAFDLYVLNAMHTVTHLVRFTVFHPFERLVLTERGYDRVAVQSS